MTIYYNDRKQLPTIWLVQPRVRDVHNQIDERLALPRFQPSPSSFFAFQECEGRCWFLRKLCIMALVQGCRSHEGVTRIARLWGGRMRTVFENYEGATSMLKSRTSSPLQVLLHASQVTIISPQIPHDVAVGDSRRGNFGTPYSSSVVPTSQLSRLIVQSALTERIAPPGGMRGRDAESLCYRVMGKEATQVIMVVENDPRCLYLAQPSK